jgi:chromosome partitioning protein
VNRTIAIVNRKGGSGKTVSTFNLAGAMTEAGRKVLTIDLDPQGSLTKGWGLTPAPKKFSQILIGGGEGFEELIQTTDIENLWAIAADSDLSAIESGLREVPGREFRLRRCLQKFFSSRFDYILLDCPPSLGSLTQNALVATKEVLIPIDGGTYSRDALATTLATIHFIQEEINYDLKLLGVLICNVKTYTVYDSAAEQALRDQFRDLVFETVIPTSIKVDESVEARQPLVYYMRSFRVSDAYRELAREIEARA